MRGSENGRSTENRSATSRSTFGLSFGREGEKKQQEEKSSISEVSSPVLTEGKRDVTNPISLFGSSFKQSHAINVEMTETEEKA